MDTGKLLLFMREQVVGCAPQSGPCAALERKRKRALKLKKEALRANKRRTGAEDEMAALEVEVVEEEAETYPGSSLQFNTVQRYVSAIQELWAR